MEGGNASDLPPGFRFHPTDEELIMYYLKNQAMSRPCPISIIPEVDIYKFDPWELPGMTEFGEKEWYFFTPRDRKYPNGVRPNRATTSGYWKATGTDKPIHSGSQYVGVKKALVFYKGRPPKGIKTVWIMHEYRLGNSRQYSTKMNGSMRLDDWVLCRIYMKRHMGSTDEEKKEDLGMENAIETKVDMDVSDRQAFTFPRTFSLGHLLEVEYMSISHLLSDNSYNENNNDIDTFQSIDMAYQFGDSIKLQGNQNVLFNQQMCINPVIEFQ